MVIVVFGDLSRTAEIEKRLKMSFEDFVGAGGALLIASDRPWWNRAPFGVRFPGAGMGNFDQVAHHYRDKIQCPLIRLQNCLDVRHPVFKGLFLGGQGIATNCPTPLVIQTPRGLTPAPAGPLVQFPGEAGVLVVSPRPLLPGLNDPRRFLLIGGHGLFMNQMMAQPDLENFEFSVNIVDWLKGSSRTRVLFLDEGQVVNAMSLPLQRPPLPPLPNPTVEAINNLIDRGQRALDEFQTRRSDDIGRILLLVATGLVLLYGIKKFVGNRYHAETPMLAVGIPNHASPESVMHERVAQMIRQDQHWEASQVLLRQWFRSEASVELPFPMTTVTPPHVEIRAGFWERRPLTAALDRVWALARRSPIQQTSARQFAALKRDLEKLTRALHAGKLEFSPASHKTDE